MFVHFGQRLPVSGWLWKPREVLFFCIWGLSTLNPKHQMLVVVMWESSKGTLVFLEWCPGNQGATGQSLMAQLVEHLYSMQTVLSLRSALQKPRTVGHTCNPSTPEVETGRSEVQGHPQLPRKFSASL